MRGILDMVFLAADECDVDGPLRPIHVIECCPDEKKTVFKSSWIVVDSQMRRGGELYTITYRVRLKPPNDTGRNRCESTFC